MARPSDYTPEMAATICARIAEGESLRAICFEDGMPSKSSVFRWLTSNSEFRDSYTRARETQAEAIFDELLEIADDGRRDYLPDEDGGGLVVDHDHIQRAKLRIDARKWVLAKMLPKKYGDKTNIEHSGSIGLEGLVAGLGKDDGDQ